jgi:uncharacterized protein YcbK (DUF882 family)
MLSRPSKHYTWKEVNPHGFPGLTFPLRVNAVKQAHQMEKLRAGVNKQRKAHGLKETGIHVLSWWRPAWYNKQIHGALNSQHIRATACDIDLGEIDRLFPWHNGRRDFDLLCNKLFKDGGFGQYPGGSRHVDNRGYKARWTTYRRT